MVGWMTVETGLRTVLMEIDSATERVRTSVEPRGSIRGRSAPVVVAAAASWTVENCVAVEVTVAEPGRES